jgi:hypothetical protein
MTRKHRKFELIALLLATMVAGPLMGCRDTSGPAVAVSLNLHSIDGVVVPVQLRTPGGKLVTLANGKVQGTNWGHACGAAFRLAEGPITAVDVPDCRLAPGEELITTLTFSDSRFPGGSHLYRFVP